MISSSSYVVPAISDNAIDPGHLSVDMVTVHDQIAEVMNTAKFQNTFLNNYHRAPLGAVSSQTTTYEAVNRTWSPAPQNTCIPSTLRLTFNQHQNLEWIALHVGILAYILSFPKSQTDILPQTHERSSATSAKSVFTLSRNTEQRS